MSGTSPRDDYGGGRFKSFLAGTGMILTGFATITSNVAALHDKVFSLTDSGHGLLATIVFSFFVAYVMHDMIRFRDGAKVFLAGIGAIAIAAYWWIGFMGRHGFPLEPILPPSLYPPNLVYLLMAVSLAAWAYWDIQDALKDEFTDKGFVFTAGSMLIVAIGLSLIMTLRLPASAAQ